MFFHFFCTQHSCALSWLSTNDLRYLFFFPYQVCKPANKLRFPVLLSGSRILHIFAKWQIWLFLVHWIKPILFTENLQGLFFSLQCFFFLSLYANDLFQLSFQFDFSLQQFSDQNTISRLLSDQNSWHNIMNCQAHILEEI